MNNERQLIKYDERPKQKFLSKDIYSISNVDLLSIIINPNCKYIDEIENSNRILNDINGISNFEHISYDDLKKINGISSNDIIRLLSSIELTRRIYYNDFKKTIKLNSSDKVFNYMKYELIDKQQEYFYALYLDTKKCLIKKKLLFIGTLNRNIVHPREIFKYAYLNSASSIICVHNHPSGDPNPSLEDNCLTNDLEKIGRINGIEIADHIIIGDTYYSYFDNGKL